MALRTSIGKDKDYIDHVCKLKLSKISTGYHLQFLEDKLASITQGNSLIWIIFKNKKICGWHNLLSNQTDYEHVCCQSSDVLLIKDKRSDVTKSKPLSSEKSKLGIEGEQECNQGILEKKCHVKLLCSRFCKPYHNKQRCRTMHTNEIDHVKYIGTQLKSSRMKIAQDLICNLKQTEAQMSI